MPRYRERDLLMSIPRHYDDLSDDVKERYQAIHLMICESEWEEYQRGVDSGAVWHLEGSIGRAAMDALETGAVLLGTEATRDAYGNEVPAFWMVQEGSKGSLSLAESHYAN